MTDAIITPVVALPENESVPEVEIDLSAFTVDTSVKALSDTRFGGYGLVFNQRDQKGDTFLPDAYYGLDWGIERPALYHHGLKGDLTLVGKVDTLRKDAKGIYVEGDLVPTHDSYRSLKANIDAGKIFFSTLTHPAWREPKTWGDITRWPIAEVTLTDNPVERRGTNVSARAMRAAFKAIGSQLPDELDETDERETPRKRRAAAKVEQAGNGADTPKSNKKEIDVTPEEIRAIYAEEKKKEEDQKAADLVAAAARAELEKMKAERDTAIAALAAQKPAAAPLPVQQTSTPRITAMSGNRMMENWNSLDMAYYANFMKGIAESPYADPKMPLTQHARRFMAERSGDQDRKFDKEFGVRAFQELSRKRIPSQIEDQFARALPYKSIDDAWAGTYGSFDTMKANELSSTGQAGSGTEFVPNVWRQTIWERIRLGNAVAANMQIIPMPSNPYFIDLEGADPTMYYTPETTDAASLVYNATNTVGLSKPVTAKATLTAKKLAGRLGISMEYAEDALAFMIPRYHFQLVRSAQNAVDNTLLNGDTVTSATTNINFIDGTPGTAPTIPSYIAFDGMRKYCILTNTAQFIDNLGAAPTLAAIRNARKALGPVYSMDMDNLVYIIDYATYFKCIQLPEFSSWVSMGAPASNLTGVLPGGSTDLFGQVAKPIGMIDNSPVYVSSELGLSLATGKKNGTTLTANVFGNVLIYHKTRWYMGVKRDIDFEAAVLPLLSDVQIMQVTVRCTETSFDTTSAVLLSDIGV